MVVVCEKVRELEGKVWYRRCCDGRRKFGQSSKGDGRLYGVLWTEARLEARCFAFGAGGAGMTSLRASGISEARPCTTEPPHHRFR